MRRFAAILAVVLLAVGLALPVQGESAVHEAEVFASVSADGRGTVTLQMQFYMDAASETVWFPVPENASNVVVNGTRLRVQSTENKFRYVDIGYIFSAPGLYSLNVSFSLSNMVALQVEDAYGEEIPADKQQLILTVPLLTGFAYRMDALHFTVDLPRELSVEAGEQPVFYSGYYQSLIQSDLDVTVSGNRVTGTLKNPLKGRDTLRMELSAWEMFPQIAARQQSFGVEELIMCILGGLALLYWLLTLRAGIALPTPCAAAPESMTAGQVGTALIGQGCDLTLMVLSWAQMGYLLIQQDDNGRVLLHKRMEMGNERSNFENRCFRSLFARRRMVDGTGYHYAQLCRKLAADRGDGLGIFRRRSGNPNVIRILGVLMGMLGGVSLSISLSSGSLLFGLVAVLFVLLCGVLSVVIQYWVLSWKLRSRLAYMSLVAAGLWLGLGALAQDLPTAACVVAGQFLLGFAAAYGGRRSEGGRQLRSQMLGLRKHLRSRSRQKVRSIYYADPEYFFAQAPYAIAMGVEKSFARSFGPTRVPGCPYLTTGMDGHMTPLEWIHTMTRVVNALNQRQLRLPLERLLGR